MAAAGMSYVPPQSNPVEACGPVIVVGPEFAVPYPVDLTITQKFMTMGDDFVVTDVNEKVMMKAKGKVLSLRDRRTLYDHDGNPVVTMHGKVMSAHRRWFAFRGEGNDTKNLLFELKKSRIFQIRTQLDVFLAGNTKQEVCDFKIKGSYADRSCTITLGDSEAIVAQMHRKHKIGNIILGKDTYGVTVYPNVDYAFVVALIVILDEVNEDRAD